MQSLKNLALKNLASILPLKANPAGDQLYVVMPICHDQNAEV
jgi:hypothetical protein